MTGGYTEPKRFFEDSGLVDPKASYHVELGPVTNTRGQDIRTMVDRGRYFSIFAPRQSGKTTFFRDFCRRLEKEPAYVPILLSFQTLKNVDVDTFYHSIAKDLFQQLMERLEAVNCPLTETVKDCLATAVFDNHTHMFTLFETLNQLINTKRIVIFIDEFDGIPRIELENFLITLRELYQRYKERTDKALYSVGLVGIRNITKLIVGGVSPFNIADQVKLPPFSLENVRDLYGQYTAETNQPFTEDAVLRVHHQTGGQPWLVNRLGTILTVDVKPKTIDPITEEDVELAIAHILKEHNSHFDNLLEKAKQHKEAFVEIVFNGTEYNPDNEDQAWLEQYGLICEKEEMAQPSNPIYRRRFLKAFFQDVAEKVDPSFHPYYLPDRSLNMERILIDFEKYVARIGAAAFHSTRWPLEVTGKFQLTAWLYQFVSEGDGGLYYESRSGLGIMDILLVYRNVKYIIETKINRYAGSLQEALEQLTEKYLLTERVNQGYIVMFDPSIQAGELCTPQRHAVAKPSGSGEVREMDILSLNIAIGKPE